MLKFLRPETFWGPICYTYNKDPQKSIGSYLGPFITHTNYKIKHNQTLPPADPFVLLRRRSR